MNNYPQSPRELAVYILTGFYVERDLDSVLQCFCEDITWIGPCDHEYFCGIEVIKDYFQAGSDEVPSCTLDFEDMNTVMDDGQQALVMGRFHVRTDEKKGMLVHVIQRCSVYALWKDERWMVQHLHTSNIYEDMHEDKYFPTSVGHQTLDYVNKMLKEKTEVLDMISDNMNGGLKGSYDDAAYTFFYVNEGLCRMLGYTYDEFMEMSHGCAVGAVYPPDLPAALQTCAECFAKGPTYRAEYRIQKKDGSLLWVLDSGKKYQDADGKMKINSLIIDITDMKRSEMELNVERERYRIALENITDVMFEYDIERDLLVKYERKNYDRKNPVEKLRIPHYFDYMEKACYIHLDDIGTLKAYLCGELKDDHIEIRLYQGKEDWMWIRVTCTYVYDAGGEAMKCIGIWRDITEEKMTLDSLIDLSKRDALTHLYNLRSAEAMMKDDLNSTSALIIMDIDHFKRVNDTFGHLKGNEILLAVTKILNEHTDANDIVSRIGGDEFLIYMSGKGQEAVLQLAKDILSDARKIVLASQYHLTLSIGIVYHREGDTYAALFKKADEAMYTAKRKGKDQIAIFQQHGC